MSKPGNQSWVDRHLQFVPIDNVPSTSSSPSTDNVRIVSWNILANQYTRYQKNVPIHVLSEHYRIPLWRNVLQRFMSMNLDFICLQEVDVKVALQTLKPSYTRLLTPTGHGRRGDTRVDACCIFYRTNTWDLSEMQIVDMDDLATLLSEEASRMENASQQVKSTMYQEYQKSFRRNNYGIVAKFKNRSSGKCVVVVNTHLYWDPAFEYVKLCQAHYLATRVEDFCSNDGNETPAVLWCGDLNSQSGGLVHTYLTQGSMNTNNVRSPLPLMGLLHVEEWLKKAFILKCPFQFKSSYADPAKAGQEVVPFTNVTNDFVGCLDYVLYTPKCLRPIKRLRLPESLDELKGRRGNSCLIPNEVWPSDHLAVGAELVFLSEKK